ncbi:hypothetical protein F442_22521 [Phytophthora nicotianae P10297]|uniref:Uncharacterized protein n=1 Tax=Phytophthora nicotianae P10297 TaxID=1317064 RepID=W2XZS0_PHYNI|nr:hypothetical protein F442_22521 [Phytophthora nicotianae P10297]
MATPGDDHEIAAAPPTNTTDFFKWCQQHLQERGWGRLDQEAARFLRSWGLIQRGSTIDVAGAIRRLLDAVPQARITKPRLIEVARQGSDADEAEWLLPGGVTLTAQPTYQMRTILDDRRVNGRVVFLTAWEPTWEPATNLPSGELRKYRQRKRRKVERAYIEKRSKMTKTEIIT